MANITPLQDVLMCCWLHCRVEINVTLEAGLLTFSNGYLFLSNTFQIWV